MAAADDLLALLAIARVPVSVSVAAAVLNVPAEDVISQANELEAKDLILEAGHGYTLAPATVPTVSPAMAAYLAERLAQNLKAGPAVRGRLLIEAGNAEEAWTFLSQAGIDTEHRRHDSERVEIIELALHAREAAEVDGGDTEGRLLLQLAMLHRAAGRSVEAQHAITRAVRLLQGEELVDALGFAAAVADDRQHPQEAERWVAMAQLAATHVGLPAKVGSLLTFQGRELSRLGFADEAAAVQEKGEQLLAEHGSAQQQFYGRLNRAWIEFDQGRVREAEMDFAMLVEGAESIEGEASRAGNLAYWARCLYMVGRPDQGAEVSGQALALAEQSGARSAQMIAQMANAEGALLFDRAEEALTAAEDALSTALEFLPAWENATRYLKARALALNGRIDEARAEVDAALEATPAGADGIRWRSRLTAYQLALADTWNHQHAVDLTDVLLQSRWLGAAADLMTIRAVRDRDSEVAADAAALAMQLGNAVQAGKAIEAGKLWSDDIARSVANGLRTLPAAWSPDFLSNPTAAEVMAAPTTDEDTEALRARIEEALGAAGLSGELVLSPAQRRAAGLVRPKRRPRRPVWQLATAVLGVAVLAIGSAVVTINLLAPPTTTPTISSAPSVTVPPTTPRLENTEIALPSDRLIGTYGVRGGNARIGQAQGGFDTVTGYYWRQTPGGSIVTTAITHGPYIYFGTDENIVYGLEMQSGLVNMTAQADSSFTSDLVVGQPGVGVGEQSSPMLIFTTAEGTAYAYDALRSGPAVWQAPIGRARGAPLVTESLVVFATAEGFLRALDLTGGQEVWTLDTGGHSFAAGPTESEGIVYAATRDGDLYLLSAETGEPLCPQPVSLTGSVVSSPVLSNGAVFVGLEAPPGIQVFAAGGCSALPDAYAAAYPSSTSVRLGPAITEDTLFLVEERLLVALSLDPTLPADPTGFPSPWEGVFAADNLITTPPVLAGDRVYVGSQDGVVYAVDAASGQPAWSFDAESAIRGELVVVPNAVFATTAAGELVVIAGE
jgi:outer membrane protein assembly factor BamB